MAKVKIQGHASGTGILTVTAPDTDVNRTITLPDATGTLAITTDDDDKLPLAGGTLTGNLGIGTSPVAAHSAFDLLQVGGQGAVWTDAASGANKSIYLSYNSFYSAANSRFDYIASDEASDIQQNNGDINFRTASAGTAGDEATMTTQLSITNDGRAVSPFTCRGWIMFASGTTINDSHNVSSISDNSTGNYSVNWDVDLPSENYAAPTSTTPYNNSGGYGGIYTRSGATATMNFRDTDGNNEDCTQINCVAFDNTP